MEQKTAKPQRGFLSVEPADRRVYRPALAVAFTSLVIFVLLVPFDQVKLAPFVMFVPIYLSCMLICDLITVVLLMGQFRVLQTASLLFLAGGYWFTALSTVGYALGFPGFLAPEGLLGGDVQTTPVMYSFWHGVFPLYMIAYSLFRAPLKHPNRAAWLVLGGTLVFVTAFTLFANLGHGLLPAMMVKTTSTDMAHWVLGASWAMSLVALVVMAFRRPYNVLDVWVMVVLCVWLADVALSAMLNGARYDVGWYSGRVYGMVGASFLLFVLLSETARSYGQLFQVTIDLASANRELRALSMQDGLTGLANRRAFDEYLREQVGLVARYRRPMALVIVDVDHFKAYNDHYGHLAGDDCLKQVGAALRSVCRRTSDRANRYGGEEFALILPDTDFAGAQRIAEAARQAVNGLGITHEANPAGEMISVSGGVASVCWELPLTVQEVISVADDGLYRAKQTGRNRIEPAVNLLL